MVVLYGGLGETHESAFISTRKGSSGFKVVQGDAIQITSNKNGTVILNYKLSSNQTVVLIGNTMQVIIVNTNAAYSFWVPEVDNGTVIVRGPYLIRSAKLTGNSTIALRGDLNQTQTEVELIMDDSVKFISFNGRMIASQRTVYGSLRFTLTAGDLGTTLPDLEQLQWASDISHYFFFSTCSWMLSYRNSLMAYQKPDQSMTTADGLPQISSTPQIPDFSLRQRISTLAIME